MKKKIAWIFGIILFIAAVGGGFYLGMQFTEWWNSPVATEVKDEDESAESDVDYEKIYADVIDKYSDFIKKGDLSDVPAYPATFNGWEDFEEDPVLEEKFYYAYHEFTGDDVPELIVAKQMSGGWKEAVDVFTIEDGTLQVRRLFDTFYSAPYEYTYFGDYQELLIGKDNSLIVYKHGQDVGDESINVFEYEDDALVIQDFLQTWWENGEIYYDKHGSASAKKGPITMEEDGELVENFLDSYGVLSEDIAIKPDWTKFAN